MNKRGGILIECLMSLIIMQIILSLLVAISKNMLFESNHEFIQDQIMIYKLNKILVVSSHIEYNNDYISYRYQNNDYQLIYKNNKLIITPGTQVIVDNISEFNFQHDGFKYCKQKCRLVKLYV